MSGFFNFIVFCFACYGALKALDTYLESKRKKEEHNRWWQVYVELAETDPVRAAAHFNEYRKRTGMDITITPEEVIEHAKIRKNAELRLKALREASPR